MKCTLELSAKAWSIQRSSATAYDYVQINRWQRMAMQTEKLPHLPFDPITHHSTSNLTACSNTQAGETELIRLPDNQEGRTGKTGPASREPGKLWPPQEASSLWIRCAC